MRNCLFSRLLLCLSQRRSTEIRLLDISVGLAWGWGDESNQRTKQKGMRIRWQNLVFKLHRLSKLQFVCIRSGPWPRETQSTTQLFENQTCFFLPLRKSKMKRISLYETRNGLCHRAVIIRLQTQSDHNGHIPANVFDVHWALRIRMAQTGNQSSAIVEAN